MSTILLSPTTINSFVQSNRPEQMLKFASVHSLCHSPLSPSLPFLLLLLCRHFDIKIPPNSSPSPFCLPGVRKQLTLWTLRLESPRWVLVFKSHSLFASPLAASLSPFPSSGFPSLLHPHLLPPHLLPPPPSPPPTWTIPRTIDVNKISKSQPTSFKWFT